MFRSSFRFAGQGATAAIPRASAVLNCQTLFVCLMVI
jgi:hypothetical protein